MKPQQVAFMCNASGQPEALVSADLTLPAGSRLRLVLHRGAVAAVLVVDQPTPPVSAGQPTPLPARGTEGTSPPRPTAPLSPENRL